MLPQDDSSDEEPEESKSPMSPPPVRAPIYPPSFSDSDSETAESETSIDPATGYDSQPVDEPMIDSDSESDADKDWFDCFCI